MKELEQYLNDVFGTAPGNEPTAEPASQPVTAPLEDAVIESEIEIDSQPATIEPSPDPESSMDFLDTVSDFVDQLSDESVDPIPEAAESELALPTESVIEPPAEVNAELRAHDTLWEWNRSGTCTAMCLEVAGIAFAIPKAAVTQVLYKTRVQGECNSSWKWGTALSEPEACVAVDTGFLFMGERYQPSMREDYRKVIVIGSLGIALAATAIVDEIEIPGDAVTWRTDTATRPWLAGTWPQHPCALIDLTALLQDLLEREDERN